MVAYLLAKGLCKRKILVISCPPSVALDAFLKVIIVNIYVVVVDSV